MLTCAEVCHNGKIDATPMLIRVTPHHKNAGASDTTQVMIFITLSNGM